MLSPILHILQEGQSLLEQKGVDSPRLSAELLMAYVLQCSRLDLIADRKRVLSQDEIKQVHSLFTRRAQGEPVAYILGTKEFYGLDFRVTPDVLIPRPETEHIVEEVEQLFDRHDAFVFADLGTGSGALAVTIASLFPNSKGVAVDASISALEVARGNGVTHGVADRVVFLNGDFTSCLFSSGSFDLIVTNPPYVTQAEFDGASHEVVGFEPSSALVSGDDGLDHIRALLPHAHWSLKTGGQLLMEIGYRQGDGVKKITASEYSEFGEVRVIPDLAGLDRIVFMQKL